MHVGDFIGDTRLGGSCNADHMDIIPHCNGTHTECLGHITHERISVSGLAKEALYLAAVVTIDPVAASVTCEDAGHRAEQTDLLITRGQLELAGLSADKSAISALIVRTLPNDDSKTSRNWTINNTPYFSVEAMQWVVEQGINHLLVDTPSVDRLDDGGQLQAHRLYWGMTRGSHSVHDATRPEATITELIFVPDEVADGLYLLNLQIAPIVSDAAPSRPLLFPIASE
jgi:kynurenine formamidase